MHLNDQLMKEDDLASNCGTVSLLRGVLDSGSQDLSVLGYDDTHIV